MPRRIDLASSSSDDDDGNGDLNPSLLIIGLIIIGVFIFSTIIHFLLRFITRLCKSAPHISPNQEHEEHEEQEEDVLDFGEDVLSRNQISSSRRVVPLEEDRDENQKLIESLPLFSFESVTGLKSTASADCAVCLSRFERHDQLRLLPICCHAFHSDCIDTWLSSNTTCPLCRSEVNVAKSEDYRKLFRDLSSSRSSVFGNDSFRIEIGSVSRRRISPLELEQTDDDDDPRPRSYSMGSFEYVVDVDESAEVVVEQQQPQPQPQHRRGVSEFTSFGAKDEVSAPATETTMPNPNPNPPAPGSEIAGEVGEGRGWLRDYVDKLAYSSSSSLSRSLRFSGRFFTGSNRMSEGLSRSGRRSIDIAGSDSRGGSWDLEGNNRYGEEISNFFRWISGV